MPGGSGATSRPKSLNATIAFFVVAKEATLEDVTWLPRATLANIVVVSYDVWVDDAVDDPYYQVARKVYEALALLNEEEEFGKGCGRSVVQSLGRRAASRICSGW